MSTETRGTIELMRDVAELGDWEFRESHRGPLGREGPAIVVDEESELLRLGREMVDIGLGQLLLRPLGVERSGDGRWVVYWDRRVID